MSRGGSRESFGLMDFEYDNKHGPVDAHSPFLTSTPARTRQLDPTAPSPFLGQGTPQVNRRPAPAQQSHFASPSKNAFATPNRPSFAQSGPKPLPSIPPHVSPWALRTPAADYDFSSGGETPNTPAQDSEQATPDTHMAGRMKLLMDSPSPKKSSRRQSFFRALKGFGSPSPTKEKEKEREIKELGQEVSRKRYSDKLENRVVKRRASRSDRSSKKRRNQRDDEDEDDDEDEGATDLTRQTTSPSTTPARPYSTTIAAFFHWLEAHPGLPAVLSYYLQFLVNTILALTFIYGLYSVWRAVTADISVEASKHQSELMVEIAACAKNYRENRCEPDTRVPAMEMACGNWETCMGRDPRKLAEAQVGVKAMAKIVNGFFEEFSYRSLTLLTILIFGGFNVSNWAFGLLRQSHSQHAQHGPLADHHPSQPYNDFAPQTPHRSSSAHFLDNGSTPWQDGMRGFQPQSGGMPLLMHSQSTPAVMGYATESRDRDREGEREREGGKTPSRRRGFR